MENYSFSPKISFLALTRPPQTHYRLSSRWFSVYSARGQAVARRSGKRGDLATNSGFEREPSIFWPWTGIVNARQIITLPSQPLPIFRTL